MYPTILPWPKPQTLNPYKPLEIPQKQTPCPIQVEQLPTPRSHPDAGRTFGGFLKLGVPTIMENQMETKMENEMETGII